MEEIINTIVQKIVQSTNPDKIILFGSRSRGLEKPHSDYDLLVIKRNVKNRRVLSQQLYRTLMDVPAAVDIIVETPEKIAEYRHISGYLYAEAAKGRVVYER